MGTPAFAVPTLDALIDAHEVVAVYARPDAGSGRGRRISTSPVKQRALETGIPVEQPASMRDAAAVSGLRSYAPDLIVVAAYGAILPPDVIDFPRLGCVNVHASLLPAWRGAAPIQRAILAGDALAGISIMRMEAGLDTGPICSTRSTTVGDKDATSLTSELALMGAKLLTDKLPLIVSGEVYWAAQDDSLATYAAKITALDVALHPGLTVDDAWRRVRASGPSAPCKALIDGRRVTVLSARPSPAPVPAWTVSTEAGLLLGMEDGALLLETLTPEDRSGMAATDWLRGARLSPDTHWSAS